MDEQIARIEREIEVMQQQREHHNRVVIGLDNAIAMAASIVAMLRDGAPLPSEEPESANTEANTEASS